MNLLSVEVFIGILLASAVVYFMTGSIFSVIAVFLVLCLGAYFLGVWLGVPLELPVQFAFDLEHGPQASIGIDWSPHPAYTPEVFYIAGDSYTYKDAPNVCAVYDAQLATYDQILEAYAKGAEWCGYGWTAGGMALYPTQEKTWKTLREDVDTSKRTSCGRPGINGGYFDLNTKFGVNCYGVKPACDNRKYPIPVGSSAIDNKKVNEFKKDMGHIKVWPFSRDGWSMWTL